MRFFGAASLCASAMIAALILASPAVAQDSKNAKVTYPRIGGEIAIEIHNDWNYDSDDAGNKQNDLFTLTQPELVIEFQPGLTFKLHGVLETIKAASPGEDREFEDQGLFAEELNLTYETGPYAGFIGKYTPNFGHGWSDTPGVYGTDFAEAGYEWSERWGFGARLTLGDKSVGSHTIEASTFFKDTTLLSKSLIQNRGRTRFNAGGVSNTLNFSSFAIAIDGTGMPFQPGFGYHAAFVRQHEGKGGVTDETGFAIGGRLSHKIGEFEFVPFVEYVRIDDLDGVLDQDRDFLTAAVQFNWRNWNLALAMTLRDTDIPDADNIDDESFQISAGYIFNSGISIDLGWKRIEESRVDTDTIGVMFAYTYEF